LSAEETQKVLDFSLFVTVELVHLFVAVECFEKIVLLLNLILFEFLLPTMLFLLKDIQQQRKDELTQQSQRERKLMKMFEENRIVK
jgi:hypothetical protein